MILAKNSPGPFNPEEEIIKRVVSGNSGSMLLIVPTNRKIRAYKKEIIDNSPGMAAGRIFLETIGTFATKMMFSGAKYPSMLLSDAAASVLLKQSCQELKLNYFSGYKKEIPAGTLDRIKNVISEYKKHGVSPELLMKEAEKLTGTEKLKAEDISRIYEKYLGKCNDLGLMEIGDIYSGVVKMTPLEFIEKYKEIFPGTDLAVINGFDEFTTPEINIIDLLSSVNGLKLYLSFDYYRYNPLIFSHLDDSYNKFIRRGFKEVEDSAAEDPDAFKNFVRQNLFNRGSGSKPVIYKNKITKHGAADREEEVEYIAKEIKNLILTQNAEPHKICVVFNLINNYTPLIRDIFPLYGLPFNLTDRFPLSSSAPVTAIINFLEILEDDFYYKNIFRALSGGFITVKNLNLSNLLDTSVKLKIISGYRNWNDIINDALHRPEDEYTGKFDKMNYAKALNDIKTIYEMLKPFAETLSLKEFKERLIGLISALELPLKIVNGYEEHIEENAKALSVFSETASEILNMLALEFSPAEKFPLKFYLNILRTAVTSARFNIKEKPDYGVQITTLNEIRGLRFDYLFIGGMADGDMPTRYTPEIFNSGTYVRSERIHQTEERYLFYQSLCSWDKKLYLSYPQNDNKEELVESGFLTELSAAAEIEEAGIDRFENQIFTIEDFLIEAGNNIEQASEYTPPAGVDIQEIQKAAAINQERILGIPADSVYSGYISEGLSGEAAAKLNDFKDREYSITQLEKYALCPYQYFAERVLKLKTQEEPSEDMEALEMGSLLHVILYEFYTRLKQLNITLAGAGDAVFRQASDLLFKIAEEQIEKIQINSTSAFYEKEKILGIAGRKENSILYKFLTEERNNLSGFTPVFFETGFGGMEEKGKDRIELEAGGVKVRGKIDRIDISEEKQKFIVTDYKSGGKKPSANDLTDGLSLQLPLYLYAAKEIIKAELDKDFEPASADIYSLKFQEKNFGRKAVRITGSKKEDEITKSYNELIEICLEAVSKYTAAISEGKFNLSTLKNRESKVCCYCSFKSVCRVQELNN